MSRNRNALSLNRRSVIAGGAAAILGLAGRGLPAQSSAGGSAAPDLSGRTALVTGSTSGLGREVAKRLGALGATVIVHGRNRERGAEVVDEIEQGAGSAVFYRADFASFEQIRELAARVREDHDRLDLLINNAGIWTEGTGTRRTTEDGHELVFQVNYLAGFLLTHRLLPLLEDSAPARIVNIASVAQQAIEFDNVMLTSGYSASRAYAQSKLAQVMFAMNLAEQLEGTGVTANSLHPATLMDTEMVEQAGIEPRASVDDGAEAVMKLAVSPALEGRTGLYFNGLEEARANDQAYDASARDELRALSARLTGIDAG